MKDGLSPFLIYRGDTIVNKDSAFDFAFPLRPKTLSFREFARKDFLLSLPGKVLYTLQTTFLIIIRPDGSRLIK